MAVHVFLSFVEEDIDLVHLFRGQAKNNRSDLEFSDYSIKVPINSTNAPYIKQEIKKKIKNCSIILCLIGTSTHASSWVKWELEVGNELNRCIIGVRLHSDHYFDIIPQPLIDHNSEVVDWVIEDIMKAIGAC